MAVLDIRMLGDPVLRRKAEPVGAVDDDVRGLLEDLYETMYDADGVGLAAPQVGIERRVAVVDIRDGEIGPVELIDPEVVEQSEQEATGEEGCLSIPGLSELVDRPANVVVETLDREGEKRRIEAEGLFARALQHEIDHLNGILFLDRISPLKRRMLLKKWKKANGTSGR